MEKFLSRRLSDTTSLLILLGLTIITTTLWFTVTKAQAVSDNWSDDGNVYEEI